MRAKGAGLVVLAVAALAAAEAEAADLVIGDTPGETFTVGSGSTYIHTGNIVVMGTGQFNLQGDLYLTGHLYVTGSGVFLADGGRLHLQGNDTHIWVNGSGKLQFHNGAVLHYVQTYVGQHMLIGWENAVIELHDSGINCDGSAETIILRNSASYDGLNVLCPDWKTWYLYDTTALSLTNVSIGGDIVFYDAPTMSFNNVVGVMPWLYFGSGAVVDYTFPQPANEYDPVTLTINSSQAGFSGIPWSLQVTNCTVVAWGVNPYPGSNVTVRDSALKMVLFRFVGPGAQTMQGILQNRTSYADLAVPVADRNFRLVNTEVTWWKVDVIEDFQFTGDEIIFSEMMVRENSVVNLTNSTCEGQTIHLGVEDNAFVDFRDGEIWSYVSVWNQGVLVLRDSLVDWTKGEYIYTTRNIAHNNSRLYCLNTTFGYQSDPSESEPEAFDSALAMNLMVDLPSVVQVSLSPLTVPGSAWIKAGPSSPVTFAQAQLAETRDGLSSWSVMSYLSAPVTNGTLGTWDIVGKQPGAYRLKLTLWVNGDSTSHPTDQYPAEKVVWVTPLGPTGDSDGDGLTDSEEVDTHGTSPLSTDSDGDSMPDDWEITYAPALDPTADDANADPDGDGYLNIQEYYGRSDPTSSASIPSGGGGSGGRCGATGAEALILLGLAFLFRRRRG